MSQDFPQLSVQQIPVSISESQFQSQNSAIRSQENEGAPQNWKESRFPSKFLVSLLITINFGLVAMGIVLLVDSSKNSKEIEDFKDEISAMKFSNSLLQKDIESLQSDDSSNQRDDIDSLMSDLQKVQRQISNILGGLQDLDSKMNQQNSKVDQLTINGQTLSRRIDNGLQLDLEKVQRQISKIQGDLLDLDSKMNQQNSKVDQLAINGQTLSKRIDDVLISQSSLTTKMDLLSSKFDKLTSDEQVLSKSYSDLSVKTGAAIDKVNSDLQDISKQIQNSLTLGSKGVQIYGPFSPNAHSWSTTANGSGLKTIDTTRCSLKLLKKSLVTLTANMHAYSTNGASILAFQINRNVMLAGSGYENWRFGAGFINDIWHHVGYTQEYILDAGDYEVSVGVDTQSGQSGRIIVNGLAFKVKVTEL